MNHPPKKTIKPEVWGGLECTINRVQDQYFDQFDRAGQYQKLGDLKAVCDLGITKLRFPILWERHHNNPTAWAHTSKQLEVLGQRSVIPIAGLMHHGSGPFFTSLLDEQFPELLAAFAKEVATAFPSIKYYTPVNEPLTTARFSGLYGFWYPHGTDDRTFTKIFLNQLKAIVLSMQAIRKINPDAQLVQTEDLCKVHSIPALAYQADFENGRRWWTYDFLTSKVTKSHPAWDYFVGVGITHEELQFFIDNPCVPAVVGFNYYVTSERYLDDNVQAYPPNLQGGNKDHIYVDTEAVRSGHAVGLKTLLTEAWVRFQLPMALTECHLSCTREQQLRWIDQHWKVIMELSQESVCVLALTAWALLGAYDWNTLVTERNDFYESGAIDIGSGHPRPTAVAHFIRNLSSGMHYAHPVLRGRGWWDAKWKPDGDIRPIIIVNAPFISEVCTTRFLHVVSIRYSICLQSVIVLKNAWAVITDAPDESAATICNELDIPYLFIANLADIDKQLDNLIDNAVTK